jgi:chromate transport protein ChrA
MLFQPMLHGSAGILDEVLVYCLPLIVLLIILSAVSRRARKRQSRDRIRRDKPAADDKPGVDK